MQRRGNARETGPRDGGTATHAEAIRPNTRRAASAAGAAAALVAMLSCAPLEVPDESVPNTPARMAGIVSALETALPYAQEQAAFESPAARDELRNALRELRRNASALELHTGDGTPGFRFFSRRLTDDVNEISARFDRGSRDEARFLLNELANDCAGCHVRLPDPREHVVGAGLTARFENTPLRARAKLFVATRQFEAALSSYEALFAAPENAPSALDFGGELQEYLVVALRVRSDFARAERTLAAFAARPALPSYLAQLLATWRAALAELAPYAHASTLVEAREVLGRAEELRRFPADRSALVHDLVASALLHRALARGFASPDEAAEASYLLGVAELRNDPSRGLPQAEWYLESAVRSAPGSDLAREAYALLESQTLLGWSGSAGIELPDDVRAWLRELRALAGLEAAARP